MLPRMRNTQCNDDGDVAAAADENNNVFDICTPENLKPELKHLNWPQKVFTNYERSRRRVLTSLKWLLWGIWNEGIHMVFV